MEWSPYDDAKARLKWDSNKNALWELNWKLLNNKTKSSKRIERRNRTY